MKLEEASKIVQNFIRESNYEGTHPTLCIALTCFLKMEAEARFLARGTYEDRQSGDFSQTALTAQRILGAGKYHEEEIM